TPYFSHRLSLERTGNSAIFVIDEAIGHGGAPAMERSPAAQLAAVGRHSVFERQFSRQSFVSIARSV
ncbi:MAG: hypothetical protein ACW975_13425, partial [Candidatus Thorarchaeota archaeon]